MHDSMSCFSAYLFVWERDMPSLFTPTVCCNHQGEQVLGSEWVKRLKFTVRVHVWCVLLLLLLLFCCCCVTVSFPRLCQVMRLYVGSCWSVLHYPSVCLSVCFSIFSLFVSVCASVLFCVCLYFVCSCLPLLLLLLFLLLLLLSPGLFSLWYLQIGGHYEPNAHHHVSPHESTPKTWFQMSRGGLIPRLLLGRWCLVCLYFVWLYDTNVLVCRLYSVEINQIYHSIKTKMKYFCKKKLKRGKTIKIKE